MANDYFSFYVLSYFNLDNSTNISQILHVFSGKRTPSMFYRVEKNKWHAGFDLNTNIQIEHLEKVVNTHEKNGYLFRQNKGFLLTKKGQEACQYYFKEHYYPQHIDSFTYTPIRSPFWERLQLYSQVFSELSYQNTSYLPVIKHPRHQENVRNLFQQFDGDKNLLLTRWVKENAFIFQKLEKNVADLLMSLLTGHQRVGLTKMQARNLLGMLPLEFHFYLMDAIEIYIKTVKRYEEQLSLLSAILKVLISEQNLGLSASTKQTFDLLRNGYSIQQISNQRSIKPNTVKEHILEMAFVFDQFPYRQFIPSEIYQQLTDKFNKKDSLMYKEAKAEFDSLEFMHFRLVELERMRVHERKDATSFTK